MDDDPSLEVVAHSPGEPASPVGVDDPVDLFSRILAGTAGRLPRKDAVEAREGPEHSSPTPPTRIERLALPISSLPFRWMQLTASARRPPRGMYVDGMAVLLELALAGVVDVPLTTGRRGRLKSGSALVVSSDARHNQDLDGWLERLRAFGDLPTAQSAAVRLAPDVATVPVPTLGANEGRARLRDAIVGDEAMDIRIALLVWMLKQDCALGGVAFAAAFPRGTGVSRRDIRRAGPDFYALADHEVAATAHRVLFALFVEPQGGGVA